MNQKITRPSASYFLIHESTLSRDFSYTESIPHSIKTDKTIILSAPLCNRSKIHISLLFKLPHFLLKCVANLSLNISAIFHFFFFLFLSLMSFVVSNSVRFSFLNNNFVPQPNRAWYIGYDDQVFEYQWLFLFHCFSSLSRCAFNYLSFYPTALKGCRAIVFTHGVRMGGWVFGAGRRWK